MLSGGSSLNQDTEQRSDYGVVEAYYGKEWRHDERAGFLTQLAQLGFGHYLYAPKADSYLRQDWSVPYPDTSIEILAGTLSRAKDEGLSVGVGFSPLGLGDLSRANSRLQLATKIEQLNGLNADWLGIFFDDFNSAGATMARQQLEIVEHIASVTNASQLIVCPSYYTTDPILEKVFGARPAGYWTTLGKGIDPAIDLFWTGEKVCSASYDKFNLEFIADQYRRLPALWDNYPVNDGERMSQYLHLKQFSERPEWIKDYTSVHFANPMNQAHCSILPLSTLPVREEDRSAIWRATATKHLGELAETLFSDLTQFSEIGLNKMSEQQIAEYSSVYGQSDTPVAREICRWLSGEYVFDPNCLTS